MSRRETLKRHCLVIKLLRYRPATFKDIKDALRRESEDSGYPLEISERTFLRDKNDILALWGIEIVYDMSSKTYRIDEKEQPEANERILEAFDMLYTMNWAEKLPKYLYFEKRKPKGTEHLSPLLTAIKDKMQVKFAYQKYGDERANLRQVEPYALKEFRNRWYLLSKDLGDGKIKSFALDRLTDLEQLKKKFRFPDDLNVEEYYTYCFGIISPNGHHPEQVILSFDPFQGKYIKSLPLHHSQTILIDNDEELRIQLIVFVTHDLVMELRSFGDNLKVLQPQSLIEEIKTTATKVRNRYK